MISSKAKGNMEVELITLKKENEKLKNMSSNIHLVEKL